MTTKIQNRWLIAIISTILMMLLGTVYAWSVFQASIVDTLGWSESGTAWAFSTNILFLGLAAAWGGINMPKYGFTKLAVIGAIMYGAGFLIGSWAFSIGSLPLLIIGFGIIGGIGIGLGYVTPVVSASKWFPDKQGFVTGMIVMGFGLGALFMSGIIAPIFSGMVDGDLSLMFLYIGIIILFLGILSSIFVKQPPTDYVPEGYNPPTGSGHPSPGSKNEVKIEYTAKQAIGTRTFIVMWLLLFINVTTGIMFIGFQSPLMQDLMASFNPAMTATAFAAAGATLVAISSLFNGIGRFFRGGLSEKIGWVQAFRLILGSQMIVIIMLLFVGNPYLFGVLVCYVLLCYGGGFGTMPSFVKDVFTAKLMPVVYGVILTSWAFAGIVRPQIVVL